MDKTTACSGSALRRVLAARGVSLSPDEAAGLASLLLDLALAGVLQPGLPGGCAAAVHQSARPSPKGSSGDPAVVRCGPQDPTVYNMGSSAHRLAGDAS